MCLNDILNKILNKCFLELSHCGRAEVCETGHKIQFIAKALPKMLESLLMAWILQVDQRQKKQTRYLEHSIEPWKLENVLKWEQSGSVAPHIHCIFF